MPIQCLCLCAFWVPNEKLGFFWAAGFLTDLAVWPRSTHLRNLTGLTPRVQVPNNHIPSNILTYITTSLKPSTYLLGPLDPGGNSCKTLSSLQFRFFLALGRRGDADDANPKALRARKGFFVFCCSGLGFIGLLGA